MQITVAFNDDVTVGRPIYTDTDEVVLREINGDDRTAIYFTPKQIPAIQELLWALREVEAGGDPLRLSTHTAVLTTDHVECGGGA